MKQIQLSKVNTILEVLKSIVSESFLSTSKSECPKEIPLAASVFPVISCFASVIKFVNEGLVNIPQDTVKQFLEVATILNIVKEEDVHQEDYHGEEVGEEEDDEEGVNVDDEDIRTDLWWDNGSHQYQLYWDDNDIEDCNLFSSEESEDDEKDFSVAHRVMARRRRARLGSTTAEEVTLSPPPCSPSPTSPSPTPRRRTETKRDPFITALLRTIHRTAPKSVFNNTKAEVLRKERAEIKIANIIPCEFRTLWDSAEPEDEEVEDDSKSVPDPYPVLDWSKVNSRFLSNIPKPGKFPIHGCSLDPAIYEWSHIFHYPEVWGGTKENIKPKFVTSSFPFGEEWGYNTSAGIISVSNVIHHGYIWNNGNWILHAQQPREEMKKASKDPDKLNSNKKQIKGKKEPQRTRP